MDFSTAFAAQPNSLLRLDWRWRVVLLPTVAVLVSLGLSWVGDVACSFSSALLTGVLLVASVTDLKERKIPNWLTYSALLWGLALNAVASGFLIPVAASPLSVQAALGTVGLLDSLLGAACCFGLMLVGYLASGSGAGDVKLLAAVGAIGGVSQGVNTLLWGYLVAGTAIVLWQIAIGNAWSLASSLGRRVGSGLAPGWVAPPSAKEEAFLKRPFPLAAAFAAGALITFWGGGLINGGARS